MRRKYIVLTIILIVIVADLVLANLPSPVPTSQAVSSVEQNPTFKSIISSNNATFTYFGSSNDPEYSTQCINGIFGETLHLFSPFHEYTTTSLIFFVSPFAPQNVQLTAAQIPFLLFVQINPSTGQIYSIQRGNFCV
jgi:hypothetical protein